MGLPNINISFRLAAQTAIARSEKGTLAVILKDAAALGGMTISTASEIPSTLTAENTAYLQRGFIGYVTAPTMLRLYVLPEDAPSLTDALDWMATQTFDYLCGPVDCSAEEAQAIVTWVIAQRDQHRPYRAVLPNMAADHKAIINVAQESVTINGTQYDAAALCSRIAGILCGTPMAISCTYAPLPEVADLTRYSNAQANAAIDAGKLILVHDGVKAKIARGINSLTSAVGNVPKIYQKIKIVELLDMIACDLRTAIQDNYIGKYPNTYDNKLLLVTAVSDYLREMEQDGLLKTGSVVSLDVAAQRAYLMKQGVSTVGMTDAQILQYNTADEVFLAVSIVPLDAIENVAVAITLEEVR